MRGLTLLLALFSAGGLFAFDDEPDQLSWEFFSMDRTCVRHYLEWAKRNPPPVSAMALARPESAPYQATNVWIKPADKPTGTPFWHAEDWKGVRCLKGDLSMAFGANRPARIEVEIPADGNYRVWMRYAHRKGGVESMQFKLCAAPKGALRDDPGPASFALLEQTFSWSQQFPHSNGRRPLDPIPTAAVLPTTKSGFRWEGTHKTAFLRKGKYVILLKGGSFGSTSRRLVSDFLFTTDPLYEPPEVMTKDEDCVETRPMGQTATGPLYALRPGGVPAPSAPLKAWWLAWRDVFLETLKAKLHSDDYEGGYLASLVYFDERANLIGRADEIAAQRKLDAIPPETYAFDNVRTAEFTVTTPGLFVVWTRLDTQPFRLVRAGTKKISIVNAGREVGAVSLEEGYYPENKKPYWIPSSPVRLKAGKTSVGLVGGGTNMMGRCVVTRRTDFNPRRHWEFPAGDRVGESVVGFWRAPDPFGAYTRYSQFASASNTWLFSQLGAHGLDAPCGYVWRKDIPSEEINRERHELTAHVGEVKSELLILRNNSDKPIVFKPKTTGDLPMTVRLVASILNSNGSWVPKILLHREEITLPPHQNTGLWLSIDCRSAEEGDYRAGVAFAGGRALWNVRVRGTIENVPAPWMSAWHGNHLWRESNFAAYRDLGMNMLLYVEVPKATTDRYGIRMMTFVPYEDSEKGFTVGKLREVAAREREMFGREPKDYCLRISDEPTRKEIPKWNARARIIREAIPGVNLWYNSAYYPTNRAEFAEQREFFATWDIACSFLNCFSWDKPKLAPIYDDFRKIGKIKLVYNTFDTGNCENFPDSPRQIFNLASAAKREGRDGWSPHNLGHGWFYDDVYCSVNTVFLYPGTHGATLLTRGAEAVREANQRWRAEPDETWRVAE